MSGAVCRTNPAQPSQSLIKSVCYPHLFKVNTKVVLHGYKHEADAIKAYGEEMKNSYADLKLSQCGLVINKKYPWIHATPDFLVSCTCCWLGCGEIKCPVCIDRSDFDSYVLKKNSCLEKVAGNFQLKRNHNYFFQVQQQLFTLLGLKYNDFVVHSIVLVAQQLLKKEFTLIMVTGRLLSQNLPLSGEHVFCLKF